MERRQSARTNLMLRCHVKIGENTNEIMPGKTENISRRGLMLRLANHSIPSAPPIKMGQYLEAYVEMPRSPEAKPLRSLCCKATVVWQRTDESGDMLLGLSVQQMAFRDLPRHFSQMATDLSQRSCVVM